MAIVVLELRRLNLSGGEPGTESETIHEIPRKITNIFLFVRVFRGSY